MQKWGKGLFLLYIPQGSGPPNYIAIGTCDLKKTKTKSSAQRTALLDTNVWRYIADSDGVDRLFSNARKHSISVAVAPATILEMRELKDAELRKKILSAATDIRWTRLLPEAYSEIQEFKSEVRRLRPQWIRINPDLVEEHRLRYDWIRRKGGFWDRARQDLSPRITDESLRAVKELELAREEAIRIRKNATSDHHPASVNTHLQRVFYAPSGAPDGHEVEYWRACSQYIFSAELQVYTSPYREWLDGEIDFCKVMESSESFERLWYQEISPTKVPRQWLRGAFGFLQSWHKVTAGTPVDAQIATHLVEVDFVLSADKNFVRFAQRCKREAPFRTAAPQLISSGEKAMDDIERYFAKLSP